MKTSRAKYFLAIISLGLVYGTMFNLPYMKYIFYDAMLETMGCTNTQLGLLLTVYTAISIVGLLPGGWIADKFKTKGIIVISAFAQGAISIFFAFTMRSYACAMITWIVSGFAGVTAFWAAILKAVSMVGAKEEQGRTYGYYEGFCGVSAAITNVVALWAFSQYDSSAAALKTAVLVMGVMSIIGGLLVHFFFDESTTEVHYQDAVKKKINIKDTMMVFKMPKFYLACTIVFCAYGIYTCQSFITTYFTNVLGASIAFAGGMAILKQYALKFVGGPIGGICADKIKSVAKLQIIVFTVMLAIVIYIANVSGGPEIIPILTVVTLLLATVCFMSRGTMWASIDEAGVPKEISGTAIAVASIIGFNLPDVCLPPLIGSWLDKFGNDAYSMVFTLLTAMCLAGVLASVLLIVLNKRDEKKAKASA
ncbi:MAG: MFS transporter [Oscillospiraceae bacterium]